MLSDHDYQFSREACRQGNPNQLLPPIIKCQSPNWDEADSHAQRYQIYDQIEVVELHRRFKAPPLALYP
jgi:hypothetical protein